MIGAAGAALLLTVVWNGGSVVTVPELIVPSAPLALTGKDLQAPVPGLTRMTDPSGKGFRVVRDPLDATRLVVRNINFSGYTETHETMGTYRDLPAGSTSYCVFGWLYRNPTEFEQTGRNLVWQNQQTASPIAAVSTDRIGDTWSLVDRIGGIEHRHKFGPIAWDHWTYFVVGVHESDVAGSVVAWYAVDHLPDVTQAPRFTLTGDTYQGDVGHNTIGQYQVHSASGASIGYFDVLTRAATASRAIHLAANVLDP